MNDNSIMPFGKYKGEKLGFVPGKYLLWLNKKLQPGPLKTYIENNAPLLGKKNRQ